MTWKPIVLWMLTLSLGCAKSRTEELGVDVFSADTVPARIHMNLTGTLQMALRADEFYTTADKSLVLGTPASLIIQKGEGTATIVSLDTMRRIAVQPMGTPPLAADTAGVVGVVVKMTRTGTDRRLKLEVERP